MGVKPYEVSMARPAFEPLEQRLLLSVTTVSIEELDGVTTANYPVTLSMIFKEGDIDDNVTAKIGQTALDTQTDVKVRWEDGSVKHALISFLIPTLSSHQTIAIDLDNGGANHNSDWVSKSELLNTQNYDFEAVLSMDNIYLYAAQGTTSADVSARALLAGIASPEYWIQGEVCSEILIRDFTQNVQTRKGATYYPQLNVQFYVRTYEGWDGIRIDTVVENCWTEYRGNVWYDFDLNLGYDSPTTVFSKNDLQHNYDARWHKVFWSGSQPSDIEISYDFDYMISTGMLPNYDTSLTMPVNDGTQNSIVSQYNTWLASAHDIMEAGIIQPHMPNTGGRQEIGPYPNWAIRYLMSMDSRMMEVALNCGDLSGSAPIHYRESDPSQSNKLGLYKIISIDIQDRNRVWADMGHWTTSGQNEDLLPPALGDTSTAWTPDVAHQGAYATIPYLVTGDVYYFEEMNYWAAWDLAGQYPYARNYDEGLVKAGGPPRAWAWGLRNIADAANLAPDDLFAAEKAYYNEKIQNNIDWFNNYITGNFPSIHFWATLSNNPSGGRPDPAVDPYPEVTAMTSPWQDDFFTIIMGHMQEIGWEVQSVLDWMGESLIERFTNPDYNPYLGTAYHIPTHSNGVKVQTWAEIRDLFVNPNATYFIRTDYMDEALAALAYVEGMDKGDWAYEWVRSYFGYTTDVYNLQFAIKPKTMTADTTAPAAVADLLLEAGATIDSVILTWTASGDDGGVGLAKEYDIRYSTSPITSGNWAAATQAQGEPTPQSAGAGETHTISGLNSSNTYYFAMKVADNARNTSGVSNVVSTAVLDDPADPAPVTDLAASPGTPPDSSVALTWTSTGDDGVAGTAAVNDIRYSTSPITEANWAGATQVVGEPTPAVAGTPQNMTVTGLPQGTTLYFAMKAFDEVGKASTLSNVVSATTTSDSDHPAAISDLTVADSTVATVDLTWTATGDDGTTGVASTYDLRYSPTIITPGTWDSAIEVVGEPAPQPSGSAEGMTVRGLQPNTTYYFAIVAIDNVGMASGLSNVVVVTTPQRPPGVVIDFGTAGDEADFVNLAGSPVVSRIQGHGGWILDMHKNNSPGSVTYSPSGGYPISAGTVEADVRLRFYGPATGTSNALIMKEWTDSQGQHGGYVVTLQPSYGNITLFIGASRGPDASIMNYNFYRAGTTNHTDFLKSVIATYTPVQDTSTHDLGWWHIEAVMTIVNGDDVQIGVTVTDPNFNQYVRTWTDTMSAAVTGAGPTGLSVYGQYNIHGQFDNFVVTPEYANLLPTVNAGPDAVVTLPGAATLYGSASDDGKPTPPGALSVAWSVVSGPGTVTFADPDAAATTATFSAPGDHVLRLAADDGSGPVTDDMTVTASAIDGDINCDGIVNVGDLAILAGHWQQPASAWEEGDLNDDGVVNVGDLALLSAHWGDAVGGAAGAAAMGADGQDEGGSLTVLQNEVSPAAGATEASPAATNADASADEVETSSFSDDTAVWLPATNSPGGALAMPGIADLAVAGADGGDATAGAVPASTASMPAVTAQVDDELVDVLGLAALRVPLA